MEKPLLTVDDLQMIREQIFDGHFFTVHPDGVQHHDVASDQPLEPRQIPPKLWQHPEVGRGLLFLRTLGDHRWLTVHLLTGGHSSAEDFDRYLQHESGALQAAPIVALEANSKMPTDASLTQGVGIESVELADPAEAPGRHRFQQRQLAWLEQQTKTVVACERPYDNSDLARGLDRVLHIYNNAGTYSSEPHIVEAVQRISWGIYQANRQPAILGTLGARLLQLEDLHMLPADEPVEVAFPIGAWHQPSAERLRKLNVRVAEHAVPLSDAQSTPAFKRYGAAVMDTYAQAFTSLDFLHLPSPSAR
jgi:hypothetical protein